MPSARREPGQHMLAEIHQQPDALLRACSIVGNALEGQALDRGFLGRLASVVAFGSGSSYHAALIFGRYLESIARLPARVDFASEAFRYDVAHPEWTLAVALSHSGSSADARAALRRARRQGIRTLGVTNVEHSPLSREADEALFTGAGPEQAVPSTKGFTALVAAGFLLASHVAALRGEGASLERARRILGNASGALASWLRAETFSGEAAGLIASSRAVVFLGGGLLHPVALDGALKLLEVAYIPALAFTPEEFRHGPMALVEKHIAVVALGERRLGSVAEAVEASGATLVRLGADGVPRVPPAIRPLVYAPAVQLLAHAVGSRLGRSIDAPRGLRKIVE